MRFEYIIMWAVPTGLLMNIMLSLADIARALSILASPPGA